MALKFLNKKGWHTGSLRNIENVWKAEQKHEAEQKKLEELKKQILEERERAEFRQLQEQAGLIPKQERLDFLYDSGLAVGKGSSSGGFKELESYPKPSDAQAAASASASTSGASAKQQQSSAPGALFEEKPQSANDTWRKLHSDPLLLIRKREQEALARVKNNPVQMAMIRKSVEAAKHNDDRQGAKEHKKKHHHKRSKHRKSSSSKHHDESDTSSEEDERRRKNYRSYKNERIEKSSKEDPRRNRTFVDSEHKEDRPSAKTNKLEASHRTQRRHDNYRCAGDDSRGRMDADHVMKDRGDRSNKDHPDSFNNAARHEPSNRRRNPAKLSEEERAARLREMQMDAELHEEQRWKRLKKADESDAQEAIQARASGGRNFLDAAQKSIYGAEKGGSSTIEESVRRRSYYSQNRSDALERNAFRR